MDQYAPNRGRLSAGRRNFGSDEVEQQAIEDKRQLRLDQDFAKEYGHYFNHRDIRKKRKEFENDPEGFKQMLCHDPEIMIRDKLEAETEIQRHDLIVSGRRYAQRLFSEFVPENFEKDSDGIKHFKPKDVEKIKVFNETFEENNEIYETIRGDLEDMICESRRDPVIIARRKIRDDKKKGLINKEVVEQTLHQYDSSVRKLNRKKEKIKPSEDQAQQIKAESSRSAIDRNIERLEIKKEVLTDLISGSEKDPDSFFGSQEWFKRNKRNLKHYIDKYQVEKYRTAHFKYDRDYRHFFVFIPSGGGKTTLATKYSRYIADIDDMIYYENNKRKLAFIAGYSEFTGDWRVNNNYWQEMFLTYEYKFRNRIIVCHGPQMLPEGTIDLKDQAFIILPSVKKWDLRFFKDNYNLLKELNTEHQKVMLHYRYYFYVIYHYFYFYDEIYQFRVPEK